ncbi:MAG TPA: exo-alpha-sialidase [Rariglobus sp.]|nr:exo-alpha-sialidase [Rariglobus sp.]
MFPPLTNCHGSARVTRSRARAVSVFKPSSWEEGYSHHAHLTSRGDRLFATWSIGLMHEDGPGQRMVMATSDDFGETWSTPVTVVAPVRGEDADSCITNGGLHFNGSVITGFFSSYDHTRDGLIAFAKSGVNEAWRPGTESVRDVHAGAVTSADGGLTWQKTATRIPGLIINLAPTRLASGRLFATGHRINACTDDPAGLSGWKISPLPGLPEGYYERAGGHRPVLADWNRLGLCEGAIQEVPGKPLRLILRTNQGCLAATESTDDGLSWGEPQLTGFTDCGSRFQFGRLPDGRHFALSCPDNQSPRAGLRRTPLVLAVSEDGDTFDRHFILGDEPDRPLNFPGAYKHGRYGYPYAHVLGDRVFVINSVAKEEIELHVFDLRSFD